jgi:hypothetical protein
LALLALLSWSCTGSISGGRAVGEQGSAGAAGDDASAGASGQAPSGGSAAAGAGGSGSDSDDQACEPMPTRVTRLQDRHISNAIRDLLELEAPPAFRTASSSIEAFIPNKAASVTGAVALELRSVAEQVAAEATQEGKPAVECDGEPRACAEDFIERFASRAFHAPLDRDEREGLRALYDVGVETYGGHADGIRVVIEGALQAPSFVYVAELGEADGTTAERAQLSAYELATKLALFLRDGAPDDALWAAAESGELLTEAGLRTEIERLLEDEDVKRNVTAMFRRLFQLDRIFEINKAESIEGFSPELVDAMYRETERFLEETIWNGEGTLEALLTSSTSYVDARMAAIYGIEHPGDDEVIEMALDHRAGILTQPSLLTIEALPDQSSVVHRGVFIARELLCFHPPAPMASDLEQGQAFKEQEPTERGRAGLRAMNARCKGCHGYFDPLGLPFEHYDTLGRYRTEIATPDGPVEVDATSMPAIHDVTGDVDGALELSAMLGASEDVRACMARQVASYAFGARVDDAHACGVEPVARAFEASGGDLAALVAEVATWDGLRMRSVAAEEEP